jgi:hypothetical protein
MNTTTEIKDYNTQFEGWRKQAFDLKDSEVELTKLLSLSLVYEQVKKNPDLSKEFYRAIKAAECVSFDNNNEHLIIDFGDTMFKIKDAYQEIFDKVEDSCRHEMSFEKGCDFDEYGYNERVRNQAIEEFRDFDLAHYAVENLNRWETIEV